MTNLGVLQFVLADDEATLARFHAFRSGIFRDRLALDVDRDSSPLDQARDRAGFVFGLLHHGRVVATARALPLTAEVHTQVVEFGFPLPESIVPTRTVEIGRLVAVDGEASGKPYSLTLMASAALWLAQRATETEYVAYARPAAARLFRSVGARAVLGPFTVATRPDVRYWVLRGSIEVTARKLEALAQPLLPSVRFLIALDQASQSAGAELSGKP